jgi:hypothetical protein
MSALRIQGLGGPAARRATLWTYPALVATAVAVGLPTALLAWAATGWALPLAGLDPPDLPLPSWPRLGAVAGTVAAVLATLTAVAAATGRDLHRHLGHREPG